MTVTRAAHSRTGYQNAELSRQLAESAIRDGRGVAFDSSAGFDLPNGANRSPDCSWVLKSKIQLLTEDQRADDLPLCPDFVIELRSKSDRLATLQDKMIEFIENGARLAWLVDPLTRSVHVYRPGPHRVAAAGQEQHREPAVLSAEPELPGLTMDFSRVWNPEV